MSSKKTAVFLDRDGTIIHDRGYLNTPSEVIFIQGVFVALKSIAPISQFFIVTNQTGVGLGIHSMEQVSAVNTYIADTLRKNGIDIIHTYVCPHQQEDNCVCRKPSPFFIHEAARAYGIDLRNSYMIGDHISDIECADNAGAQGIYVLTGHGMHHIHDKRPSESIVVPDITAACAVIRSEITESGNSNGEIPRAAKILSRGGLAAFPTETVYGLGANAYDPSAVEKIFHVKKRPYNDPLIVHVSGIDYLEKICASVSPAAHALAEKFWPGPLTLILPKLPVIPDLVTASLPDVAVRVPDHPITLELLHLTGLPIAAPSANLFGSISPTTAGHVKSGLPEGVDIVLDGGPCRVGVESTIVKIVKENICESIDEKNYENNKTSVNKKRTSIIILRPGGITAEMIEEATGIKPVFLPRTMNTVSGADNAPAPGLFNKHYAPKAPVELFPYRGLPHADDRDTSGIIFLSSFSPACIHGRNFAACEILSEKENELTEAAQNLYSALHSLDLKAVTKIYAECAPDEGIGRALNDRLRRAAGI